MRTGFLLALAMVLSVPVWGQRRLQNQPKYDNKTLHFGFCLGLNFSDIKIETKDLSGVPGYFGVRTGTHPGYNIGIISDLRLHEHASLRFIPSFATTQRDFYFDLINPITGERDEILRETESSYIELPFELKFRSDRISNYRWYVLGGVKYNIDLASKENVDDDRIFKLKSSDFMYEMGVGMDFYFEFFKFSPQIKASFGTTNLLVQDGTLPVSGLEAIKTRSILINFTFE